MGCSLFSCLFVTYHNHRSDGIFDEPYGNPSSHFKLRVHRAEAHPGVHWMRGVVHVSPLRDRTHNTSTISLLTADNISYQIVNRIYRSLSHMSGDAHKVSQGQERNLQRCNYQ